MLTVSAAEQELDLFEDRPMPAAQEAPKVTRRKLTKGVLTIDKEQALFKQRITLKSTKKPISIAFPRESKYRNVQQQNNIVSWTGPDDQQYEAELSYISATQASIILYVLEKPAEAEKDDSPKLVPSRSASAKLRSA